MNSSILFRLIFSLILTFILSFAIPLLSSFLSLNLWLINYGCAPCTSHICPLICHWQPFFNWWGVPVVVIGFLISFILSGVLQKRTKKAFPIVTFILFLIPIIIFCSLRYYERWRGTCRVFRVNQLNVEPYWRCHPFWNPFIWNQDLHTLYDPITGLKVGE